MNIEDIRNYCISKPGAEEGFPFGGDTLVFKVNGKIFLLVGLDSDPLQFNVNVILTRLWSFANNIRSSSPVII